MSEDDDFTKLLKGDPVSEDDGIYPSVDAARDALVERIYRRYAALEERHRSGEVTVAAYKPDTGPR
jgi:hypothetical protein